MIPATRDKIARIFGQAPPGPFSTTRDPHGSGMAGIRILAHELALAYARECPEGPNLTLALMFLGQSLTSATEAILYGGEDDGVNDPNEV